MKLAGRVLLVTGASKGIGAAIAVEAAREGADVVVNYHFDEPGARAVVENICSLGRRAVAVRADVGSRLDVEAMVERGTREIGVIDLLVNNAGIALWKPFLELDEENWDRTLDTNLKSVFLCSQAVARSLVASRKKGSIVNISSIAAHGALDCLVPYCASKGGMTLVTQAMATELAPHGIRVNALAPGTVDIKRNRDTDPDYPGNWETRIPCGRVGRPEEIARPVVFLLSDEAAYVTGQTLWADGGLTSYVPMPRADFARE
ncbi:MAG TPA: 3-oxoacyl-ACP reductase family protein [Spirochaetia bacterium]|nr:3-oxoacyl-ACP reductase family protein [Spirochaetia bacterium]